MPLLRVCSETPASSDCSGDDVSLAPWVNASALAPNYYREWFGVANAAALDRWMACYASLCGASLSQKDLCGTRTDLSLAGQEGDYRIVVFWTPDSKPGTLITRDSPLAPFRRYCPFEHEWYGNSDRESEKHGADPCTRDCVCTLCC